MLKKIDRKELFYEIGAKNLTVNEWIKLDEPITWFKKYEKNDITIWEDTAYGFIRLKVGIFYHEGTDFVTVDNVVTFGNTYEGTLKTFVPYITKE